MNVVAVVAVAAEAVPVAVAVAVAVSAAAAVAVAVAVAAAVAVPGAIFGLKVPAMVECRLCRLWLRPRVGRVNAPRVRLQHGGVYEGGGGGPQCGASTTHSSGSGLGVRRPPCGNWGRKAPVIFTWRHPFGRPRYTLARVPARGEALCVLLILLCSARARRARRGRAWRRPVPRWGAGRGARGTLLSCREHLRPAGGRGSAWRGAPSFPFGSPSAVAVAVAASSELELTTRVRGGR